MNRAAKMTFVGSIILNVLLLGFVVGQSPRRFRTERWTAGATPPT